MPRRRSYFCRLESLEHRVLLTANLDGPTEGHDAGPALTVDVAELQERGARGDFHINSGTIRFQPTLLAGTADGTPPDSPAGRVSPHTDTHFNGVGSIEISNPEHGNFICTGSVISPTHVVTAAHCFDLTDDSRDGVPDPGTTARFFLNDGSAFSSIHTVSSIDNHPSFTGLDSANGQDDIALLTLATPVPAGTTIYKFGGELATNATFETVGYGQSGFAEQGYSVAPDFSVKRHGFNTADFFIFDDDGSGQAEAFLFDFDGPEGTGRMGGGTLGNNLETALGGGDSGSPVFVTEGGERILKGVMNLSGVFDGITPPPGFFGDVGSGSIIDPYIPWINSIILPYDISLTTSELFDPITAGSLLGSFNFVEVRNNGSEPLTNLRLESDMTLPPGVTRATTGVSKGVYTDTGANDGIWTLDLAAGEAARMAISGFVASTAQNGTDVIDLTTRVVSVDGQALPIEISDSEKSSIVGGATATSSDLAVTSAVSTGSLTAGGGGTAAVTVTVRNNGPDDAENISMRELLALPAGVTITATNPSIGTVTVGTTDQTWDIPSLASGAEATLEFVFSADANAAGEIVVTSLHSLATDPNPINNSATSSIQIQRRMDLAVSAVRSTASAQAGAAGTFTHQYTVTNNGPSSATGAQASVALEIPAGVTLTSVQPGAGSTYNNGTWSIGTLAAGATQTLTVTFQATAAAQPGTDNVTSKVNVNAAEADTVGSNNAASTSTSILPGATGEKLDFGDAPDSYGTSLAANGARHQPSSLFLGQAVDQEADGAVSADATGDGADDDGVTFFGDLMAGQLSVFQTNLSHGGVLEAWIDFDGNGTFDADEQIANKPLFGGGSLLIFSVPSDAKPGATFARFRVSSVGGLGPTGPAADGEVEDYRINVQNPQFNAAAAAAAADMAFADADDDDKGNV